MPCVSCQRGELRRRFRDRPYYCETVYVCESCANRGVTLYNSGFLS